MRRWHKRWRIGRWVGVIGCLGMAFFWWGSGDASAHGETHLPGNLPACTARMLSCEPPPALARATDQTGSVGTNIARPLDAHCVDGMGVSRSCMTIDPFIYLRDVSSDAKSVDEVLDIEPRFDIPCQNGAADLFACRDVDLLAFLPLNDIGGGNGNDLWGWTDPDTGREYALMGRSTGTGFIDVTDPVNPIYLGDLPSHTGESSWRDIKVYQNHAYIVADLNRRHGMQVFDLTVLRDVADAPVTFAETGHYDEFGDAHNIAINEESGFAYAVGSDTCRGGLHMIDLRNPATPTFAGCFAEDGYTHDVQCVRYRGPDLAFAQREICFGFNEDTITIVDVTDKADPVMLARAIHPDGYYVHQGWLTSDQRYILQDDELDEQRTNENSRTYVWDVSSLENPVLVGSYTGALPSADHNLYLRGSYAFQANYASGLRILAMEDLANAGLQEVGFFDTHPPTDANRFFSAWSVYPYFQSGTVIVSTITEGLFVLRPQLPAEFALQTTDSLIALCDMAAANNRTTTLRLQAYNDFADTIQLRLLEKPDGLTATFTPAQVQFDGNGEADVLLELAANGLSAGQYPLRVVASDAADMMREATLTLDVADGLPSAVTDLSTRGVTHAGATLHWGENAAEYRVEVAEDAAFTTIIDQGVVATNTYVVKAHLLPETTYHWRVQALSACGAGDASAAQTFTTNPAYFMPLIAR